MSRYQFRCKDINLECDFTVSGKDAADLIPQIAEHARSSHQMENIDDDMKDRINNSIRKKLF